MESVLESRPARSYCLSETSFKSQEPVLVKKQITGAESGSGPELALEPVQWEKGKREHANIDMPRVQSLNPEPLWGSKMTDCG